VFSNAQNTVPTPEVGTAPNCSQCGELRKTVTNVLRPLKALGASLTRRAVRPPNVVFWTDKLKKASPNKDDSCLLKDRWSYFLTQRE
jgi:hypothetical protein